MKYRLDIDGLRAIAVTSVIVFHINATYLTGGFLGVDIFFVISGFLITGILYDGLKAKTFSYAKFYERRLRRLYPALLTMLLLSCIAAAFLYDAEKMSDFGGSAIHAIFGLSNFFFYFNTSYFDVEASSRPLLHTWSLAVEEQFYVFWPLLLFAIIRLPRSLRIAALMLVVVASTAFGEYQARTDISGAFYLLPSRVAELGIGGFAAVLKTEFDFLNKNKLPNALAILIHALSLATLGVCFWHYDETFVFPGLLALPPSIATALLLLFPISGPVSWLLNNPVMRWFGLISYSTYLVHWPLLVFYRTYRMQPLVLPEEAMIFAVTIALGSLFYLFIESPFRSRDGKPPLVNTVRLAFTATLLTSALALFAANAWSGQTWTRVTRDAGIELIAQNRAASQDTRTALISADGCHQFEKSRKVDFSNCLETVPGKTNILVLGSSYAADDWLMLKAAYPDANVQKITAQGCISIDPSRDYCKLTHDFIFNSIDRIDQFDAVVISHNWVIGFRPELIEPFLARTRAPVILFGPRGNLTAPMIDLIKASGPSGAVFVDPQYTNKVNYTRREKILAFAQTRNAGFVDMLSLLRSRGGLPFFASRNHLLFYDVGHYTPEGASYVADLFRERFPTPADLITTATDSAALADRELEKGAPASTVAINIFDVTDHPLLSARQAGDVLDVTKDSSEPATISTFQSSGAPGIAIRIPEAVADTLKEHMITVRMEFSGGKTCTRINAAYSTDDNGNSGWTNFVIGPDWQTYEFSYVVPPKKNGGDDYIGLVPSLNEPDAVCSLRSVEIDSR